MKLCLERTWIVWYYTRLMFWLRVRILTRSPIFRLYTGELFWVKYPLDALRIVSIPFSRDDLVDALLVRFTGHAFVGNLFTKIDARVVSSVLVLACGNRKTPWLLFWISVSTHPPMKRCVTNTLPESYLLLLYFSCRHDSHGPWHSIFRRSQYNCLSRNKLIRNIGYGTAWWQAVAFSTRRMIAETNCYWFSSAYILFFKLFW